MKADIDIKHIRALARKWNINDRIEMSERPSKKLKILVDDEWIHFGAAGYDDYTTHRDKKRRQNYCARASGIKMKDGSLSGRNRSTANFYAMRLLWDCAPP